MRVRLAAFVLVIGVAAGVPIAAHHYSLSAYDATQAIQLKGVLTRVEWMNPHTHFSLDVKDGKGRVSSWVCETNSPGSLARRGLQRGDLTAGAAITVEGYRAKSGSREMIVRRITLPDGRTISSALAGDEGRK